MRGHRRTVSRVLQGYSVRSPRVLLLTTFLVTLALFWAHTSGTLSSLSFVNQPPHVVTPHPNLAYAYVPYTPKSVNSSVAASAYAPDVNSTWAYFPGSLPGPLTTFYHLYRPATPRPASNSLRPVRAHSKIPLQCLDTWYSTGRWDPNCSHGMADLEEPRIDFVWTWVNGSDPLHASARHAYPPYSLNASLEDDPGKIKPALTPRSRSCPDERRKYDSGLTSFRIPEYRDHGELVYSLRSVLHASKDWKQSQWHLVTNSYAVPVDELSYWKTIKEIDLSRNDTTEQRRFIRRKRGSDDEDDWEELEKLKELEKELEELEDSLDDYEDEEDDDDSESESDDGDSVEEKDRSPADHGLTLEEIVRTHRLGQVPQWLDFAELNKEAGTERQLRLHHDSEIFLPPLATVHGGDEYEQRTKIDAWRSETLPTFDSMAVESQMANLAPELVSDHTVFLMDDTFIMTPLPPSAFFSPLHGPVLRFHPDFNVHPIEAWDPLPPGDGEWRGLRTAATHLSHRFGWRGRPYVDHNARSLPLPLYHEASIAFPDVWSTTAKARFRGGDESAPESHTVWLGSQWIVERHREVLLWSWVVAKWGGHEGKLSAAHKQAMWDELGGENGEDQLELIWNVRTSRLSVPEELAHTGQRPLTRSEYVFVSNDGYPWTHWPRWARDHQFPTTHGWIDLSKPDPADAPGTVCTISRDTCLGQDDESAVDLFRRILKDRPGCGDCVVAALATASGTRGLSYFLPQASVSNSYAHDYISEPVHLPLTLDGFSSFPLPSNPRNFVLRLLQRYSYVIGEAPSEFFGVSSYNDARSRLRGIDRNAKKGIKTERVYVCINDDLGNAPVSVLVKVDRLLRNWWQKHWGARLALELPS
ncbi:hypothetical protein PUNSTDRAFT_136385 [Punctularia strigosozonata HHB-11173 SS5]|uniref:uncharacterized protein n=1 Tax=Punctularia strigosozonata (strain HHB-11173) TaxID=741275 RepID=UPI000441868C|nr:uncharacterized protein PUNSTDRAFT_136385 [Punctularia strigosozonata HHB-11173 SS5]EIN06530.1 hypothetical protein PUNSTDRAFT_136385 [Punctularia strigosozonata HHB-11173 SS5]